MEDLGEAVENFVETFSCTEEPTSLLPQKAIPSTHGNLLVASALYGHLFAAVGSSLVVYSHASLRHGDANPVAVVDLKEEHVTAIHALALGAHDTIIVEVTRNAKRAVVILNIAALAVGEIHALSGPNGIVSAFSVSDVRLKGTSQILATLEEAGVQLHVVGTDGTTPSTKINVSNARCIAISPEGDLLAVGTGRGSVVLYNPKSGETCTTIVEVESGWVPFSTHFADSRSVLVSYNNETEVRHVVWHLSSDGTAVTGHSPLGEICLALVFFDDDEPNEVPMHPMMTYISLYDWNMCVIGSSTSSDVEIIRKTDNGWEVWKFDEGKSPTLPTDDDDDDTCCVGLAFDLNNTALIPGSDAASPKINPMPRVIVYTSDSLLLPFALIDSNPGVKCDAVGSAVELPPVPISLQSIQSASSASLPPSTDAPPVPVTEPETDGVTYSSDPICLRQKYDKPPLPKYGDHQTSVSSTATKKVDREDLHEAHAEDSIEQGLSGSKFGLTNPGQSTLSQQQEFEGMNSFLETFSFKEASEDHPKPKAGISAFVSPAIREDREQFGIPTSTVIQEKPRVSLAPSLDVAEAEANGGDLIGLLRSIMTEMSEELRVSAEAEQMVSQEIAAQKDSIVSSITETRKQLTKLLEMTRILFRNEATLRNTVSSTLSKVLSLSREYEKMSLEFHVKEADGFSRSLRTEEKEIDDKIVAKEAEVLRSISSIEDRLNAEAEFQTRRRSPAELVQHVYSSLSLQGIRIRRVRSLLTALSERMDNQDKGGRLSHLGLSLARLEKLKINDDSIREHSPIPDKSRGRESVGVEAVRMPNSTNKVSRSHATNSQGDDTQLLPSGVRVVMRRLAMSGGRASISVTMPQSHTKRDRIVSMKEEESVSEVVTDRTTALAGSETANFALQESSNVTSTRLSGSGMIGLGTAGAGESVKTERTNASPMFPSSTDISAVPFESKVFRSRITSEADGESSASLPPKRPLGQTFLPPSVQRSTPISSLLDSANFQDKKQKENTGVTPQSSSFPSAKRNAIGFGENVERNKRKERSSEGSPSSKAFQFSANAAGVETVTSRDVFGIQASSHLSGQRQASSATNELSVTPVAEVQKLTRSAQTQFASLPPDDDEDKHKSSVTAPALQVATLPPDDDEIKPKPSIVASRSVKDKAPKNTSMSGFFAALPPDLEADTGPISKLSADSTEKPLSSQAQKSEKVSPVSGTFAALPPDVDTGDARQGAKPDSGEMVKSISLFESGRLGSMGGPSSASTKNESIGTSDLFAALPPDDSGNEQVQRSRIDTRPSFHNGAKKDLTAIEDNSLTTPAVVDEKNSTARVDQVPTALFGDGAQPASTARLQISPFASSFGTPQHPTAPFGNASLFGASAPSSQSAPTTNVSAPQRQSSRDGASSTESEEETTRFEGGMDTSSGGGGFFGASSSAQSINDGFGFGSKSDSTSGAAVFEKSSSSPFGSLGQGQPFGQSTMSPPPAQTGFGSLAERQGSVSPAFQNAQPTFGNSTAVGAFSADNASPGFGMESTFGAESQLGASSSFGVPSQLGMGSASFPASNPTFGGGMSAPKFGDSSFGAMSPSSFSNFPQNSAASGFGSSSPTSNASPFGNVAAASGFGGASDGGSGFAALAGGQGGPLVFGNGGGPPQFSSAAFSQRRA